MMYFRHIRDSFDVLLECRRHLIAISFFSADKNAKNDFYAQFGMRFAPLLVNNLFVPFLSNIFFRIVSVVVLCAALYLSLAAERQTEKTHKFGSCF